MGAAPAPWLLTAPSIGAIGLLTLLILGAADDLRREKISNRLTYSAMVGGLLLQTTQHGLVGLGHSAAGLAVGMGLFLTFYALGGMGAGDVKFMGAIGSMIGLPDIFFAALMAALLGGIYAVGVMIRHQGVGRCLRDVLSLLLACVLTGRLRSALAPAKTQPKLRYGVVMALGTLTAQWWNSHLGS